MPPRPLFCSWRGPNWLRPRALLALVVTLGLAGPAGAGLASPGAERRPVAVTLFLWRGETLAERGFRETLAAAPDIAPSFTVLDAQGDPERLAQQIAATKRQRCDLIYAFGTTTALALQRAIRDTPIVFNVVARPVASGLIASWAASGNNLTGVSNAVPMVSAFGTLRLLVSFRKLGFVYNPQELNARLQLQEVEAQQRAFGFRVLPVPLPRAEALIPALKNLLSLGVDAVLLPSDSLVQTHAQVIVNLLTKYGIPTVTTLPELVRGNGAFVALGPDYRELGQLAAQNALAVLRGRRPSEVPSRTSGQLQLVVNQKTAKRLGISLPIQLVKVSELVP